MGAITVWACRKPNTNLYKANRSCCWDSCIFGTQVKLYKTRKTAEKNCKEFTEIVEVQMELINA